MADQAQRSLGSEFPAATEQLWREAVDTALKGAPFEKLVSETADGIEVQPLYSDGPDETETGSPGTAPYTRGFRPADDQLGMWDVRSAVGVQDPTEFNRRCLRELERGATSLLLSGPVILDPQSLSKALEGVFLDMAPLALSAGADYQIAANNLLDLWASSDVPADRVLGALGADPIGSLARTGNLNESVDLALEGLADLVVAAEPYSNVRAVSVDTTPYAESGASEAQELAAMLSTGATYLRAMQARGISAEQAGSSVEIVLGADVEFFTTIAKVRAARRLWASMAESCGIDCSENPPSISVRTLSRMISKQDPWVNLLRVTSAAFGAALGGADSIVAGTFDSEWGDSIELSRRMARNTQLLIGEESGAARVVDPAGGSWYLETLTDEIAETSWALFSELERSGGMPAVLLDSSFQNQTAEVRDSHLQEVAVRKKPLTGVSEFPDLHQEPLQRSKSSLAESTADGVVTCEALAPVRWPEQFENLRDSAHTMAEPPKVFFANLGPVASHTARASYARNYFAAGGVEAMTSERGMSQGYNSAAEVAEDFALSGARVACICGSDETYAELAIDAAGALKASGAERVYLAGKGADLADPLRSAGVDEFIYVGVNVLESLLNLYALLGDDATESTVEAD